MKKFNLYLIIIFSLCAATSCTINSNRMLRTPKKYEFDKIEEKLSQIEYKIDINDALYTLR